MESIGIYFGKVLRKYRLEAGLSQEKLALMSKIDRTYISLLERGKRVPSIIIIFKLTDALDVKPHIMVKELEELVND